MEFLQQVEKNALIQGVDSKQKTFILLPYDEIIAQRLLYVMVAGIFIYKDSVLITKNSSGLWNVTIEEPLRYGFSYSTLLEHVLFERFAIQGTHCVQKRVLSPTRIQPYFLYVYVMYIPYTARIPIDTEVSRFIDTELLKQSVFLEPRFFTPLLIQNIDVV